MLYLSEYPLATSKENKETEHALGRSLLHHGLELEYGDTWDVCEAEGGKPYLKDAEHVHFNISHTKGLVVCGISDREIGVDVERIREFKEAILRKACAPQEQEYVMAANGLERAERFFRLWTLKESYIKAIGKGLAFPLDQISFSFEGDEIRASIPGWRYEQFQYGEQYIVSVCRAKAERP